MVSNRTKVAKIERLDNYKDEYVYDVGMSNSNHNWFFANDILVKNTDSAYFSVYEAFKEKFIEKNESLTRDDAIEMYDNISSSTNNTFAEFMNTKFNTGIENGKIIQAGRENLAEYSLFIKKKKYAMNLFDKDGFRQDIKGKNGKLKVMGIEIKRSDTPKEVQDALKNGLEIILNGGSSDEMLDYFKEFKNNYQEESPWYLGRPCGTNAVKYYTELHNNYKKGIDRTKPKIPGAIAGAIAWNEMLDLYNEDHIPRIDDGSKVRVCKLKPNDFGYNSISYPTDQTQFPDWFKELNFDKDAMLETILYKKIANIFGVLGWNLDYIRTSKNFDKVFETSNVDNINFDDFF